MIRIENFDAIIFDLGGVILHLDYTATVAALSVALRQDISGLYTQARQSHLFDCYERGELTTAEFFRQLIAQLPHHEELIARLEDPAFCRELEDGWNAMLLDIPSENLKLLRHLRAKAKVFLLSNTNACHLDCFFDSYQRDHEAGHGAFAGLFDRTYYSHQLGQRKPEARIFETVLAENRLQPERTLFIDDNRANLAGAAAAGVQVVYHPTNSSLVDRFGPDLFEMPNR